MALVLKSSNPGRVGLSSARAIQRDRGVRSVQTIRGFEQGQSYQFVSLSFRELIHHIMVWSMLCDWRGKLGRLLRNIGIPVPNFTQARMIGEQEYQFHIPNDPMQNDQPGRRPEWSDVFRMGPSVVAK